MILLRKTLGVDCVECGPPEPGLECLDLAAHSIVAERVQTVLEPLDCDDVIYATLAGTCAPETDDLWDPAGDGSYSDCPQYD